MKIETGAHPFCVRLSELCRPIKCRQDNQSAHLFQKRCWRQQHRTNLPPELPACARPRAGDAEAREKKEEWMQKVQPTNTSSLGRRRRCSGTPRTPAGRPIKKMKKMKNSNRLSFLFKSGARLALFLFSLKFQQEKGRWWACFVGRSASALPTASGRIDFCFFFWRQIEGDIVSFEKMCTGQGRGRFLLAQGLEVRPTGKLGEQRGKQKTAGNQTSKIGTGASVGRSAPAGLARRRARGKPAATGAHASVVGEDS